MSDVRIFRSRSLLLLAAMLCLGSFPPAQAQPAATAVWDLGTLDGGKTYPTTITAANLSCRGRHSFSISIVDTPWLKLAGPSTLSQISMGESKVTDAVVDPRGLTAGDHRGRIVIHCTSCPPPPKCQQNLTELEVRLKVGEKPLGPTGSPREATVATPQQLPQTLPNLGQPSEGLLDGEAFKVTDRINGLAAEYSFQGRSMNVALRYETPNAVFSAREAALGEIVRLRIPRPASSYATREAIESAGELVIGEGFRRAMAEDQFLLLTMLDRASRLMERELPAADDSIIVAIRAVPKLVGVRVEAGKNTEKPGIIVIGPNDGRCHGACGPGCSWCLCLRGKCACEVNFLCYVHDSCCGAWEHFFDCFPCKWEPVWPTF